MIWLALLLAQAGGVAPTNPMQVGAKLFATSCAVGYCHGAEGLANRGPRLRSRNFEQSYVDRVVRKGVPDSAMPGFEGRLKEPELQAVITYVMHLSGLTGDAASVPSQPSSGPTATAAISTPETQPVRVQSRGEQLFFDATREVRCATCHESQGMGISVAKIGAGTRLPLQPQTVKRVKLKDGDSFPAVVLSDAVGVVRLYDLTLPPPVLRTLDKSNVDHIGPETQWNHAQVTRDYTPSEIELISEFLAATSR